MPKGLTPLEIETVSEHNLNINTSLKIASLLEILS